MGFALRPNQDGRGQSEAVAAVKKAVEEYSDETPAGSYASDPYVDRRNGN